MNKLDLKDHIKEIQVVQNKDDMFDLVIVTLNLELRQPIHPFRKTNFKFKFEAAKGMGADYCKSQFGVKPEIIKIL
jgi:hypothetical protein